ncbi:MAG: prefoldin subunit [archaeon]
MEENKMNGEQQDIMEFEKTRNHLINISGQKQQLQFQSTAMKDALEELEKTKEKKVYKAVGNILVLSTVEGVKKELTQQKESADLRVKTLQKQEDLTVEKLNKLRARLEAGSKPDKPEKEEK